MSGSFCWFRFLVLNNLPIDVLRWIAELKRFIQSSKNKLLKTFILNFQKSAQEIEIIQ